MSNPIPYLMQGKNIIIVIDGKSHAISKDTHIAYPKIIEALKAQDWDELRDIITPAKAIVDFGGGNVTIEGDLVLWNGRPFHNALTSRMIEMYRDGFPIDPMVRFMENLMENPSKRSVDQLYGFLEKNSLPITEDGHFLAYKRVNDNFTDVYTGTIDNSVGQVVEMERNLVDDNPASTCSTGLHFCSESYLSYFGGSRIVILKINPADVVSIPVDYDNAKGRCMRYEVIGEVHGDPKDAFGKAVDNTWTLKPAAWPFSPNVMHEDEDEPFDDDFLDSNGDEFGTGGILDEEEYFFDVVRVYGGSTEAYGVTLEEARAMVEKNVRQKKAMLKIVYEGTDEEYIEE
jgi:hypothetical protein